MKNIQNYYSFQTSSIWSIMSSSVNLVRTVLIGPPSPIWSILSTKFLFSLCRSIQSILVHIGSIWSTLVLFCPLQSYLIPIGPIQFILSTMVLFSPICSYSIHFGFIWSYSTNISPILSTLVIFSSHWSYSVHFGLICLPQSNLVLFSPLCPFILILSTLVLFLSTLFLFGPILSIRSTLFDLVELGPFGSLRSILVYFNLFLCTYIMRKDMFGLKALVLN